MAEFENRQAALAAARAEIAAQDSALRQARAALERSGQAKWAIGRRGEDAAAGADLDAVIADRKAAVADRRGELLAARVLEQDLVAQFATVHPREAIGNLSDQIPICLVPLRIETRFKPAAEIGGDTGQLWVRVYPDDFSIDSFEDTPSDVEAQSARAYWAGIWAAGGDSAQERGAWAVMMAGQGAGRSHWITQAYMPLNAADRPAPPENSPWIILTIPTRAPLALPEQGALNAYFAATWRAGDDLAAQAAALATLDAAVGTARAQELRETYVPSNLAAPPPDGAARADVDVQVAFLHFPTDEDAEVRLQGWATTPRARLMPDRLVFMGFNKGEITTEHLGAPIRSDLAVAPDPQADEDAQIRPDGDDLNVGADLEWLTDFDRAVEVGMGFRIPLDPVAFRTGFDKVLVLGMRLASDAETGRTEMEELISRHHRSKSGFSILPQGRPTNNVESAASDYNWREDPDVSFDHYFGEAPADPTGWFDKTDGRWLAEVLGMDPAALQTIPHYGRSDICDAKAMNVALWPATLGYFCDTMLHPVLEEATVRRTRTFFTRHVSARGMLPAIRIGRQPYGILPVTPRSRLRWMAPRHRDPIGSAATFPPVGGDPFLLRLYGMMQQMEGDMEPLLERVSYIGKPGTSDPQQVLLDVLGLHAGSVEFQQRYAESLQQLYNRLRLSGAGGGLIALAISLGYAVSGQNLLQAYGYTPDPEGGETPSILEKYFTNAPNNLHGPLIDDVDLSETEGIRAYTETGDNYLTWLRDAAATSHDTLRKQEGFADGRPNALLFHMMRHALDLSYVETSVQLFVNAGLMSAAEAKDARREPDFMQVTEAALQSPQLEAAGNSRWARLYQAEPTITGVAGRRIGDFIPTVINTMTATAYLRRQLRALDHLSKRPTAALERCLAEHVDLCTYRLDAWYGGLMSAQLENMRYADPVDLDGDGIPDRAGVQAQTGLYVGAWGYLEDLKPEFKELEPVRLEGELGAIFNTPGAPPLSKDDKNQGYIHAPSLNHAVTAAVLRNGYVSNATPDNPESLAVNLTSERVRMALSIIDGMKADQTLAALLGYQFERGLHDRHDVEVDEFIYDLRKEFPLNADRMRPTKSARNVSIRKSEARNVIDGLEFVEHLKKGAQDYPFGLTDLPPASGPQATAISEEAKRLLDIADAVADLAMAESVHQVVQGNYDRAGAVLDTYSKGKFPATPDVIRTPRSGVNLTHRIALHLPVGLDPSDGARISPRARCEPALDVWLGGVLPDAARVACVVEVHDPSGAPVVEHIVTQDDLGLAPLDMLYLLDPDADRAGKALDDMIEAHVMATQVPRPDVSLSIGYRRRILTLPGHIPFFELTAMIKPLRHLLLESRPLRATDMALQDEASEAQDVSVSLDPLRLTLNRGAMATVRDDLDAFGTALEAQLTAEPQPVAAIVAQIDTTLASFVDAALAAEPFAQLESGTGVIFGDRARIFANLQAALAERVVRLDTRLAEFDAAIVAYDADTSSGDPAKVEALIVAERLLFVTNTDPTPAIPDAYRDDLVTISRPALVAQRDALAAVGPAQNTLSGLHGAIDGALAVLATFDPEPFDLGPHVVAMLTLATDMASRATSMAAEMTLRLDAVDDLLTQADAQTDPRRQVEDRIKAAQTMFGEDFQIVPGFALPPLQGAEWRAAWGPLAATADTSLLGYQINTLERPFPVDDFVTGFARVRDKISAFETVTQLASAFGTAEPDLQPLQFPHRADLPWLALEYPETLPDGSDLVIDEDKLLYTAHYAVDFNEAEPQAGLLLDEMTETIPSKTEDTGLTFHYDRPNSEPPQSLLLALPADFTGSWRWEDLVDSVLETMDLARKRAIEPDHIDTTPYGRFLPAVISPVTLYPITAALNFAETNNFSAVMANIVEGNSDE